MTEETLTLRRCLTATDLTMMGIGAIIGAGIFVLTGIAAATQAGPAIIFSYLLAGLACAFAALSYAEMASSFSGCGGAYAYAYAGVGQLFAWIIGWDLLLEYGMDAATVSMGWSGYAQNALHNIGINIPNKLLADPFHGGIINLPAMLVILGLAGVLSIGVKGSARFNTVIVFIKLFVIALFIAIGIFYVDSNNWKPFFPFGSQGIINGAGFIFFAYIGFDVVSTAAEETINPQKALPMGIMTSLIVCTIVYIIFSAVLTGITYYPSLNSASPVSSSLFNLGYHFASGVVSVGAIAGLTTTILAMFYAFTRVFLAMCRDGLLPKSLSKIHSSSQTPRRLIWFVAVIMAVTAGVFPINQVANIVNMGTLAAFAAVCASVVALRYSKPDLERGFKTPFSPFIPAAGIILCLYLMFSLPFSTWLSFGLWTAIGLAIYLCYGRINAKRVASKPAHI